ncbi:MAG: pyridoxal phosphate-dependent aminotransferase [Candidatus Cloacimonadota bacterium]|nr:pyridoxal phosphate-dependent aminotransferase [Candidatus Cloacimonadota bacterium]
MLKDVLSIKAKRIKPSPTLKVASLAKEMLKSGIEVINFGVGEPDFNTPENIKKEAHKAIDENFTRYTSTSGILELRNAIVNKYKVENDIDYDIDQVLVSPGAKASIVFNLMSICNPGDEILLAAPYWVSYPSQIELADGSPVLIQTNEEDQFKIQPYMLENAILKSRKPKAVILNSPNNPTGAVYTRDELLRLANICIKYDLIIIADEIYEKLTYDNIQNVNIASLSEEIYNHTITINGVSKAYAMTGWRLGYSVGPKDIIKSATRIQGHTTSCVNTITQKAAVKALANDSSIVKMRNEFEKRRNFLVDKLNNIDNVSCNMPKGAFYVMPNVSYYLENNERGIDSTAKLCEYLLRDFHIDIVPGSAFGMENFVRFSYANSMDNIKKGLNFFEKGLQSLI